MCISVRAFDANALSHEYERFKIDSEDEWNKKKQVHNSQHIQLKILIVSFFFRMISHFLQHSLYDRMNCGYDKNDKKSEK